MATAAFAEPACFGGYNIIKQQSSIKEQLITNKNNFETTSNDEQEEVIFYSEGLSNHDTS